jgi:hypothetical protein
MSLVGEAASAALNLLRLRTETDGLDDDRHSFQSQLEAVRLALAASLPSLSHPSLDAALVALARLRMHAVPHTPLAAAVTPVLGLRGSLPSNIISVEAQGILKR